MIKLINLINEDLKTSTSDGYSKCNSVEEEIDLGTYSVLAELRLDLNNVYSYQETLKGMYGFKDNNEYEHFIRLVKENDRWEIKVGFFKKGTTQPIYDRPKLYDENLNYDEKIFNTHLKILFDEIFPYFFNNSNIDDKTLYFPALDIPRFRLYRISLNKFVDKNLYNIDSNTLSDKKTIIITKK
jgi:hypothetical protein